MQSPATNLKRRNEDGGNLRGTRLDHSHRCFIHILDRKHVRSEAFVARARLRARDSGTMRTECSMGGGEGNWLSLGAICQQLGLSQRHLHAIPPAVVRATEGDHETTLRVEAGEADSGHYCLGA